MTPQFFFYMFWQGVFAFADWLATWLVLLSVPVGFVWASIVILEWLLELVGGIHIGGRVSEEYRRGWNDALREVGL